MSGMVCALSGVIAEDPVYARSGYVFERRIIEKHIDANGKCPISGIILNKDTDLLPIHHDKSVRVRGLSSSSIPGLLSLFQSEWDSLMTETYALRNHVDTVRNQLSHSLYQHDAATRVIARLIKERDELRAHNEDLQKQINQQIGTNASHADILPGISEDLESEMQSLAKKLLATRKKRHVEGLLSTEQMKTMSCAGEYPLHSSSSPGVLCCNLHPKIPNLLATGGVDSDVAIFSILQKKTLAKLQGHMKKVNSVRFHPEDLVVISASNDKTVKVWKGSEEDYEFKLAHTFKNHKGPVHSLSVHPLGDYVSSSGGDKCWAFHDIAAGSTLQICADLPCDYRCLSFHPDGMILGGGGSDGSVHIWDMKGTKFRASLVGHKAPICSLAFSENGYYLATASDDGTTRLWDLRKSLSFQVIEAEEQQAMHSVCFDYSGQYIAIASSNLSVYHFETRTNVALVKSFDDHSAAVTDVQFGERASFLVSTSMDRTVRLWKPERASEDSS